MKTNTRVRGAVGLAATLGVVALGAGPAAAQDEAGITDDEGTLAEEIPDVEIPDVEIPDVEIPDVRVGENDAVLEEEGEIAPPVAVFPAPAFAQSEPALDEETPAATTTMTETALAATAPSAAGAERVTGNISAIDLEDGTLEVDTDTQGTLRLSADRAQLRQIAPGQSVSLSYVDRDDGRWVADLQALPAPAPPASTAPQE